MQLTGYSLGHLRNDGEFVLYREPPRQEEQSYVPLLEPAATRPYPETLKKLNHQYSLRNELDPGWVVRPPGSSDQVAQMALAIEDPGGEVLDGSLGGGRKR